MKTARTKIDNAAEKLIARGEDAKHVAMCLLRAGLDLVRQNEKDMGNTIIVRATGKETTETEWPMEGHIVRIVPEGMGINIDRMNDLVEAVRAAGQQFLAYEQSHRAKGTPDADQKADVNRAMAEMCFKAVGGEMPEQNGYMLGLFPVSNDIASFIHALDTLVENGQERNVGNKNIIRGLIQVAASVATCDESDEDDLHPLLVDLDRIRVILRDTDFPVPNDEIGHAFESLDQIVDRIGRNIARRADLSPVQADSGVLAPLAAPGGRPMSGAPLDRAEMLAILDMKIEGSMKAGMSETASVLRALRDEINQHLEAAPIDYAVTLRAFYVDCYNRNVKAGWWRDLSNDIPKKRSVGELFVLMVTELVEAYDAYCSGEPDDKLPQYPGLGVELGDLQIRLADFCGAVLADKIVAYNPAVRNPGDEMFREIAIIARRYESIRKTPEAVGEPETGDPIGGQDVAEMTVAKLEFNATRADHKPENRMKEGGKQT